jgi:hypothetical protein
MTQGPLSADDIAGCSENLRLSSMQPGSGRKFSSSVELRSRSASTAGGPRVI